ncbi:class I SAM-dependent methyltransferase [Blastococcus sp. MG754426]|nr:class I SAM-dependent methyltransferase [Blastococcus sp. MG754426]MCF6513183.1 class I SAM-dependent methyltransferase [Blastococcus sp. MG754427]
MLAGAAAWADSGRHGRAVRRGGHRRRRGGPERSAHPGPRPAQRAGGGRGGAPQRPGRARAQLPRPGGHAPRRAVRDRPGRGGGLRRHRRPRPGRWGAARGRRLPGRPGGRRVRARPPAAAGRRPDRRAARDPRRRRALGRHGAALPLLPRLGGPGPGGRHREHRPDGGARRGALAAVDRRRGALRAHRRRADRGGARAARGAGGAHRPRRGGRAGGRRRGPAGLRRAGRAGRRRRRHPDGRQRRAAGRPRGRAGAGGDARRGAGYAPARRPDRAHRRARRLGRRQHRRRERAGGRGRGAGPPRRGDDQRRPGPGGRPGRGRPAAGGGGVSATDRETYDELYRSAPAVWSGRPNRQLVEEAAGLPAGTALDAGAGEGGDALWLAERGWRVTAVDFSPVALERAAAAARARGLADRVEWVHADLEQWAPPAGGFDLVAAHYLHATWADRAEVFRRLAAAVAPGGTLLVVGHLLGDGWGHGEHHAHEPGVLYTAEDVAAVLDPDEWSDVVTEVRVRDPGAAERTGNPVPDTVLVARRASRSR